LLLDIFKALLGWSKLLYIIDAISVAQPMVACLFFDTLPCSFFKDLAQHVQCNAASVSIIKSVWLSIFLYFH